MHERTMRESANNATRATILVHSSIRSPARRRPRARHALTQLQVPARRAARARGNGGSDTHARRAHRPPRGSGTASSEAASCRSCTQAAVPGVASTLTVSALFSRALAAGGVAGSHLAGTTLDLPAALAWPSVR